MDAGDAQDRVAYEPIYQPALAEQLRQIVGRLSGLNRYDRDRLHDVAAAIQRKETALDEFMCKAWGNK